ncbi:MAG: YeeE/YedE family protein [Deltaproteobacteria bacterium]|nr:YeeE/YedE family protein [Deltaproteobacteria bacterium]
MFEEIRNRKNLQLLFGLLTGIAFGFLLQKGGVTRYDVIIGQLLLEDFTVVKVMLTAVVTGMVGIHFLESLGAVHLHPKPGSVGSSVVGGVIFGVGFGILGYCPGTVMGAVGQGNLDALFGGVTGILIGTAAFASAYPKLERTVLHKGDFGDVTLPLLLKVNQWLVVIPAAMLLGLVLIFLERVGF